MSTTVADVRMGAAPDSPQHPPSVPEVKDVAPVEPRRWAEQRLQYVDHEYRIGKAINRIADEDFFPFLNEAWCCFRSDAYNSALVWVWCAVSRYLRALVYRNRWEVVFAFGYERAQEKTERAQKKRPESMALYKSQGKNPVQDKEFVEAMFYTDIIDLDKRGFLHTWLRTLRKRRNYLAHGDWSKSNVDLGREGTAEEVVEAIETVVKELLGVPVESWKLILDEDTLLKYAKEAYLPIYPDLAQDLVDSVADRKKLINVCHKLLTAYQLGWDLDPMVGMSNVKVVWIAAYRGLEPKDRGSVLKKGLMRIAEILYLDAKQYDSGEWNFSSKLQPDDADMAPDPESERDAEDLLGLWREVSDVLGAADIDAFNWLREHIRQINSLAIPFKGTTDGE